MVIHLLRYSLYLAVAAQLCASAHASEQELDALMKKTLEQAQAEGAKTRNEDCGRFFMVEGEYVVIGPEGKAKDKPVKKQINPAEAWGCNERPSHTRAVDKFESKEEAGENGNTVQYTVRAVGELSFDPSPSTEIAGSVVDKNNKPVKNAEVRAENIDVSMPPVITRTDDQGKYSLKVRSGQYRVTPQKSSCTAIPQTLWACGWGKVPDTSTRTERFPLDLVMQCGEDLGLDVQGNYKAQVDVQDPEINFHADLSNVPITGFIPLNVDAQTGAITGEGTLTYHPSEHTASGQAYGDVSVSSATSIGSNEMKVAAKGVLDTASNTASISLECLSYSDGAVQGSINAVEIPSGMSVTLNNSDGGGNVTPCEGNQLIKPFTLTWSVGETHRSDETTHHSMEGISYVGHEVLNFTLTPDPSGKEATARSAKVAGSAPAPTPPAPQGGSAASGAGKTSGAAAPSTPAMPSGATPSPARKTGKVVKDVNTVPVSGTAEPEDFYTYPPEQVYDAGAYAEDAAHTADAPLEEDPLEVPRQILDMMQQFQGMMEP